MVTCGNSDAYISFDLGYMSGDSITIATLTNARNGSSLTLPIYYNY
jgi:hypothetical protein